MVTPGAPRNSPAQDGASEAADAAEPAEHAGARAPAWDLLSVALLIFFVGLLILVAALVGLPLILG